MRWSVPERPIPEYQQSRKEKYAFFAAFIVSLMALAFPILLFDGFVENLFCLSLVYFAFWFSGFVEKTMRKEYDRISDAWLSYWGEYWEEERQLRIRIDRMPEGSEERLELEDELARMRKHYDKYYCS